MRKLLVIFSILGITALGFGVFNNLSKITPAVPLQASTTPPPADISTFTQTKIEVAEPLSFSIPSIGVSNVEVESVGLDEESKMDIPENDNNVAWYNLGAKPGEKGNAVIAGHYDNKDGSPSVFYDINKLKPGDEMIVKDKSGKQHTYAVTNVQTYELTEFPLIEVFGAGDKPMLNLITCEGNYDKNSKLYSHRLVVYSELKT